MKPSRASPMPAHPAHRKGAGTPWRTQPRRTTVSWAIGIACRSRRVRSGSGRSSTRVRPDPDGKIARYTASGTSGSSGSRMSSRWTNHTLSRPSPTTPTCQTPRTARSRISAGMIVEPGTSRRRAADRPGVTTRGGAKATATVWLPMASRSRRASTTRATTATTVAMARRAAQIMHPAYGGPQPPPGWRRRTPWPRRPAPHPRPTPGTSRRGRGRRGAPRPSPA